ncbi:MAG: pyrD [Verrucomicrobiales bacterium]|nr:pyrD [Verrucomicrobiales bacterium]
MSLFYRNILRPFLFQFDSEKIHNFTLDQLSKASLSLNTHRLVERFYQPAEMEVQLFGLTFPNPVGLAAGMDKRAAALPIWYRFGFGFSEVGGVTLHPQPGNPTPRMFRIVEDEALVNRMGFNNGGAAAMAEMLQKWKRKGLWPAHPVGINLGKSKITPIEEAASDYLGSFRLLKNLADFFVINVSSPNTPNLRQLQDKDALDKILSAIQFENTTSKKPILVKVAPDLTFTALDDILELVQQHRLAGIVATNTSIARPDSREKNYAETGGMSGRPLASMSTEVIRHLYRQSKGTVPIIGVGGIFSADDAWEKFKAGASLVQVYSGLVYEGPSIAKEIVTGLRQNLEQVGATCITEIVGTGA